MAERRMVAKSIIDSDQFLEMAVSAQNLYFHLLLAADDEGFVNNPKRIMRDVRATEGDMRELLANQYVLAFDSGVIVIRHWKLHNWIRKERLHPTLCEAEKALVDVDKSGAYSLVSQVSDTCQTDVSQVSDTCQTDVSQLTAKCQHRVVESSIVKSSSSSVTDDDFANVVKFYEDNISTISPFLSTMLGNLKDEYTAEWLMHAMEKAVSLGRSKSNIGYIEGILKGWKADGVAKPWEQTHKPKKSMKDCSIPQYETFEEGGFI